MGVSEAQASLCVGRARVGADCLSYVELVWMIRAAAEAVWMICACHGGDVGRHNGRKPASVEATDRIALRGEPGNEGSADLLPGGKAFKRMEGFVARIAGRAGWRRGTP